MRRVHNHLLILAAVAALATVAAGCGGSDDESGATAATDIFFLLPSLQDEGRIGQKEGAEAEAAKLNNVELTVDAGSTLNGAPEELVSKLENALLKEPDAIIVNPGAAPDQLTPVLQRAIDDGVKVVVIDVAMPELKGASTFVGLNDNQASATAGEWLSKQYPDGGEIGIVSCIVNNPVTIARTEGFEAGLASNIKVGEVVDAKCDPERARSMTENMLTTHPDLIGIYATTDDSALGVVKAVQAAGKDTPVIGHDGFTSALESIQDGGLAATVRNPFEEYGAAAVDAVVAAVEGESLPEQTLLESNVITKKNVSEYLGG
jgi:ribose transport system substrate-binding protein